MNTNEQLKLIAKANDVKHCYRFKEEEDGGPEGEHNIFES